MTYEEFKRLLGKAGISIKEFATLLNKNPNSYTNYKSEGSVPRHLAVIATLMSEMADHHLEFKSVVESIEPNTIQTKNQKQI